MFLKLVSGFLVFKGFHVQRNELNNLLIDFSPNSWENIPDNIEIFVLLFWFHQLIERFMFCAT